MKSGFKTSEFWLSFHSCLVAGVAIGHLLAFPPSSWKSALVALPAVCLLTWWAGMSAHNYGENRFRLKGVAASRAKPEETGPEPEKETRRIGFVQYDAIETDEEDEECEESDDEGDEDE